jgi:hypothetical protein
MKFHLMRRCPWEWGRELLVHLFVWWQPSFETNSWPNWLTTVQPECPRFSSWWMARSFLERSGRDRRRLQSSAESSAVPMFSMLFSFFLYHKFRIFPSLYCFT